MKIRLPFALAALAVLPLLVTGCAGSDDKSAPAAVSPAPACDALAKSLNTLAARIRDVDAALARLVADSVTDPAERNEVFRKALRKVGTADVKADVDKVSGRSASLAAAWGAAAAAMTDAGARVAAEATRDDVKARQAELTAALRQVDAALAEHRKLLQEIRVVLTDAPGSSQLVRARPASRRLADLGVRLGAAINGAVGAANRLGAAPVPPVIERAAETPIASEAKEADAAHAEHPAEEPAAKPGETSAKPVAPAEGVKTEPAAALAAPAQPPAAPVPAPVPSVTPAPKSESPAAPQVVDPVPEPVES